MIKLKVCELDLGRCLTRARVRKRYVARGGLLGARSALYDAITDWALNEAVPMIVHEFQDKYQSEPVALTAWSQSKDEELVRCQRTLEHPSIYVWLS